MHVIAFDRCAFLPCDCM